MISKLFESSTARGSRSSNSKLPVPDPPMCSRNVRESIISQFPALYPDAGALGMTLAVFISKNISLVSGLRVMVLDDSLGPIFIAFVPWS